MSALTIILHPLSILLLSVIIDFLSSFLSFLWKLVNQMEPILAEKWFLKWGDSDLKLRFILHEKERVGVKFKKISKFSQSLIQSVTVGTNGNLPHKTSDCLFKICLTVMIHMLLLTVKKCIGKHGDPL